MTSAKSALRDFDHLPDAAFVRLPVVAMLFATSQANVWRWVHQGIIPEPRRFSNRTTAWNVGEIRQALEVGRER